MTRREHKNRIRVVEKKLGKRARGAKNVLASSSPANGTASVARPASMELPTQRYLQRPQAHIIDERARRVFEKAIPAAWIPRRMSGDDYGIDYQIEPFESHLPEALRTAIQLKGTETPKRAGDAISFQLDTRALATYVDKELLPVFLVLADVGAEEAWFCFLQQYALEELAGKSWRDQETVAIHLHTADRLADTVRFKAALHAAHRFMASARPGALRGAIDAEQKRMESIDPRFRVSITANAERQHVLIQPRQPVSFQFGLRGVSPEKLRAFGSGDVVRFEPGEVSVKGMPLWKGIETLGGELSVTSEQACTISVNIADGKDPIALGNLPGKLVRGMQGFRIECALDTTLFFLSIRVDPPLDEEDAVMHVRISLSHESWLRRNLLELPYFDTVARLARALVNPVTIQATLHLPLGDLKVPEFEFLPQEPERFFIATQALVRARTIVERLGTDLIFASDVSDADLDEIERLHALIVGGELRGPGAKSTITVTVAKLLRPLPTEPGDVEIRPPDRIETSKILGSVLKYPVKRIALTKAKALHHKGRIKFVGTPGSEFILQS